MVVAADSCNSSTTTEADWLCKLPDSVNTFI